MVAGQDTVNATGRRFDPFMAALLVLVAALHAALTLLVPDMGQKFQLGDRAWDRAAKIDQLLGAGDLDAILAALFYNGPPGDYIFFVPAYALFGVPGVIIQNTALLLVGLWFLYRLGETYFSPRVARLASLVYAVLPATLFHAQTLASEAICNPLLIVATWFAARMISQATPDKRDVILFGLVSAILCSTRQIYLLFPVMVAGLLLLKAARGMKSIDPIAVALALSFSLVAAWSAANLINDGRYPVAPSFHGLESNLFLRAERMEAMGGFSLQPAVTKARSLSPAAFLDVVTEQPARFAKTVISDAINLAGNTGVSMVYGRYFGVFDLKEKGDAGMYAWRDIRDRDGIFAMLAFMGRTAPLALVMNVVFVALWGAMLLVGVYG
ncbi:MAG: ArnT family glycosyltransferase, partial [Methyloligellaceae bacterium]